MRDYKTTKRFRRDYQRLDESGRRDMSKLEQVMSKIVEEKTLEPVHRDHALRGEWKNYRDCHIEGDWVLIYQVMTIEGKETVIFHATDNHSNLFG